MRGGRASADKFAPNDGKMKGRGTQFPHWERSKGFPALGTFFILQ